MLLPYCVYLLVGAFYYFWLASLATVAAGIGALPILAFFGSILLFGVSGPLSIIGNRFAGPAALAPLALLLPWALGLAVEILRSPSEAAAFAFLAIGPALGALYLAVRSALRMSRPRLRIPRGLRYSLALLPAGIVLALVARLVLQLTRSAA